jgi:hypothetical protein
VSVATSYSLVTELPDCQAKVKTFGTFGALLTAVRADYIGQATVRKWVMIPEDEGILSVWELTVGPEGTTFTLSPA